MEPTAVPSALPEWMAHGDRLIAVQAARGFDERDVRTRLEGICRRLEPARVRGYLPLLAERALRIELEARP